MIYSSGLNVKGCNTDTYKPNCLLRKIIQFHTTCNLSKKKVLARDCCRHTNSECILVANLSKGRAKPYICCQTLQKLAMHSSGFTFSDLLPQSHSSSQPNFDLLPVPFSFFTARVRLSSFLVYCCPLASPEQRRGRATLQAVKDIKGTKHLMLTCSFSHSHCQKSKPQVHSQVLLPGSPAWIHLHFMSCLKELIDFLFLFFQPSIFLRKIF